MAKTEYMGITFDSELEVNYYKYLKEKNINFKYQNEYSKNPIKIELGRRKTYKPDFIVYDDEEKIITIVETKGYAKWSANEDDNIMDFMKNQVKNNPYFVISWLKEIKAYKENYFVSYRRIKFNQTYGWVDYDFKNPNTIANQRKNKIQELEKELKQLKNELKDFNRYYKLSRKSKLSLTQKMFIIEFMKKKDEELGA